MSSSLHDQTSGSTTARQEQWGRRDTTRNATLPPPVPDHELLRLIGRGSYGEVWLARNVMGTPRAVKVVYRGAFEHDRPFEREFAGLQRYEPISRSHEGLVNILHVGRHQPSQCFYCVMELADDAHQGEQPGRPEEREQKQKQDQDQGSRARPTGDQAHWGYRPRTLRAEISQRGPLPLEECLSWAICLAAALGHLHKHGLVHRDLKPSNIIFVNNRPKIADIGLVAESGDSHSFVGTEGFSPPQGPGTPQADLYALGKVLYEACTGLDRLRFPQMPADWLGDSQHQPLIEFNEVLIKACETDPARRYQSAEEMLADLALLQVGKSVRHLHNVERRLRLARRLGAVALGAAVLALAAYGMARRQARLEHQSRQRIEHAEAEARSQLAQARLAQARALRRTGEAGQRFDCLEVVAAAARAQPSLELRNEAIGALALLDLRVARRLPTQGSSFAEPAMDRQTQYYVCGDRQGNLGLRRVADDREVFRLPGEGHRIPWTGFSPNGRLLAVLPTLDRLAVWDLDKREKVFEVPAQGTEIHARFLPDSRGILWSAGSQPLRLCDLPQGLVRARWAVRWPVWRFCCSPDQKYCALSYAATNLVEVLDLESGRIASRMPQTAPVQTVQWHRSKPWLAASGHDNRVHLYDPLSGQELFSLEGHQGVVASLDFHPSLDLLASSAWDGTTRLWDLGTRRQAVVLQEAGDNIQFSADGHWLAINEYSDAHALLCQVAGEPVVRTLQVTSNTIEGACWAAAFDPTGRLLATAGLHGFLLFDAARGTTLTLQDLGRVYSVWFDLEGQHLFSSGDGGVLRWALEPQTDGALRAAEPVAVGQAGTPAGFASQVGPWLVWVHSDHVHVRKDGSDVARLQAPSSLDHLALSPDGRWVAAAERQPFRVHLWETATGKRVRTLDVTGAARLAFSPDSRFLVVGTPDEFSFWEPAGGPSRQRLPRHRSSNQWGPLAFSRQGTLLAVARTRTLIALYEYPSLREVASFEAPRAGGLGCLTFDPAGNRLAVGHRISQITVWDLHQTRQQLGALGLDW